MTYTEAVLRAPTGADVLKAAALMGSNVEINIRLIETVSGVPFDVLKLLPQWLLRQMSDYMDEFAETPAPDPLEAWRKQRREAMAAEAQAAMAKVNAAPTEVTPVS